MQNKFVLLLIEVGFKPTGLNTEQYDMVLAVGQPGMWGEPIEDPSVCLQIRSHLSNYLRDGEKIHIDGYAVVDQVMGHTIIPLCKPVNVSKPANTELFFANLGGYIAGDQREKHKAIFLLADDLSQVKVLAMKNLFCSSLDKITGALPHIDDKLQITGIDVDDASKVNDMVSGFDFSIVFNPDTPDSWEKWIITGYKVLQ